MSWHAPLYVMHVTVSHRPSALIFAYCKQAKTRGGNGLGMRLVFTTAELGENAAKYASVVINEGEKVFQWRKQLFKCSSVPCIRDLHDFVFACNSGSNVSLRV